jgi:uncharacterized SAM-binding protein YcdF (DUF218 family)
MDFTLKKIISALLLPLPIAMALLLIGLCFFWFSRRKLVANIFLSSGFVVLLIFGFSLFPSLLLNSLEDSYHPMTNPPADVSEIVVLGGGVRTDTNAPPNTQLSSASLSRLIEGVRLYRLYHDRNKDEKLILSGGRVFGKPAEAGVMQNIAVILGVKPSDIELEAGSRDTFEEAQYLKQQLGTQPFLLVTSAYHMPRAIALFTKAGLHPIAAPTQYFGDNGVHTFKVYIPNSNYLIMSDIAIHEYLGRLWSKIHGQS